jgi:hypothetical protein
MGAAEAWRSSNMPFDRGGPNPALSTRGSLSATLAAIAGNLQKHVGNHAGMQIAVYAGQYLYTYILY